MPFLRSGLAAWRLAHMLVYEDGPAGVFERLRNRTGIEYDIHGRVVSYPPYNPLHCVYCTSVYTAVLVMFIPRIAINMLAVSGLAALIEAALAEANVGHQR